MFIDMPNTISIGVHNWELPPIKMRLSDVVSSQNSHSVVMSDHQIDSEIGTLPGYRKKDEAVR